jgi:hypothetical protein
MGLIVRAVEELEWLAVGGRELPGGRAVLRLAGELDATTCGLLRDALEAQLRAPGARGWWWTWPSWSSSTAAGCQCWPSSP